MSEERQKSPRASKPQLSREGQKDRPSRDKINIQFARSLSSNGLESILQLELIRARTQNPPATEVSLPTEIIHDIKFRLRYYSTMFGEVDRKAFFGEKEEKGEKGEKGEGEEFDGGEG